MSILSIYPNFLHCEKYNINVYILYRIEKFIYNTILLSIKKREYKSHYLLQSIKNCLIVINFNI